MLLDCSVRRMRSIAYLLLVLAPVSFGGCAGGPDGRAAPVAVADTVDGISRLTWPEESAPTLAWTLDTVLVIGGFEEEASDYQFDQVGPGGLAGDAAGRLFVLDRAGQRVLGYGPGGEPIGVWGREGGGPGEFSSPTGLAVGPGDSLWVVDRGNRRVTLFPPDPDGSAGEIALSDETSGLGGKLAPGPDGIYGVSMMFSFSPGEDVDYPPRRLIYLPRDAGTGDTVWTAPPPAFDRVELTSGGSVAIMLTQRTFSPGFYWERFSDGGFVVAQSVEYELSFLAPDGSERLRIRREPPARLTTEEDRQRARDDVRAEADESTSPFVRQSIDERIEKMTFNDRIPRITGVTVDGRDRVWVGVSEDLPGETARIDVFDAAGTLVGEIHDPDVFPLLFYGEGRAAVLDTDELDVQRAIVLRLQE